MLVQFVTSCGNSFDWEPRPYVGDHVTQSLINGEGVTVNTDQPIFSTFTCFDSQNIAELRSAIGQVNNAELKENAKKAAKTIDEKVWRAKDTRDKR